VRHGDHHLLQHLDSACRTNYYVYNDVIARIRRFGAVDTDQKS
jgi:hypothetical protein